MRRKRPVFLLTSALFWALLASSALAQELAKVGCEVRDNGAVAAGSFRLLRADTTIAGGPCGKDVDVPAGPYELVVALDGVLGAREQRVPVMARPGVPNRVNASFDTGELRIEVSREGRRSVAHVQLLHGGVQIAQLGVGVASRVVVGVYTLAVSSRGETRQIEDVAIVRGERRAVAAAFGSAPPK